ncbi:7216_t:CDS:2 [Gigaspora rosea]|nr:7216_t:CDS:2 [Gigaspora rosea]
MNKDQLRELLEGLTTSFAKVSNTIANTKKELENKRELTHVKVDSFHGKRKQKRDPKNIKAPTTWCGSIHMTIIKKPRMKQKYMHLVKSDLNPIPAIIIEKREFKPNRGDLGKSTKRSRQRKRTAPDQHERETRPDGRSVGSDRGDTFDEFTYEEEMLDEIKSYHTEESATEEMRLYDNPRADIESPTIYLTVIEESLTQIQESPGRTIDEYFDELIQETDLNETEREQAREFFQEEKGLFAQNTKELGETIKGNGRKRINSSWLKAFINYEETEDRPPQEIGHVVEVYWLGDLQETEKEWDEYENSKEEKQGSTEREYMELVQYLSDDKIDWEEYYWEEYYWDEHGRKEQEYMELIQDYYFEIRRFKNPYNDSSTDITWTPRDPGHDHMTPDEVYEVNDHWEIEAEERFLTAPSDHITRGNGWYEKEEFEVYLALSSTETDPHEASDAPPDPTLTQNNVVKDQSNISRSPILDEEFFRRMEYQDLIMDVVMKSGVGHAWPNVEPETSQQVGGTGYLIEEALRPVYEKVLEDLAGEVDWDDDGKLEK